MRPFSSLLGAFALSGALLAGCGDDDPEARDDAGEAFCQQAEGLEERFSRLDEPSPELFREVSEAFIGLAENAPDEISSDAATLAEALEKYAEAFDGMDMDDPESLAAFQEELEAVEEDTDDLEGASENVAAYLQEECGIDLDGDDGEREQTGGGDERPEEPGEDEPDAQG